MSQPDCTLVIINWNTQALLAQCLASIAIGANTVSTEVFVVDNGSSDGSAAMVRTDFPAAHLIANTHNRGFSYANNQAVVLAQGRYILFLNSDATLSSGCLDNMVAFMDQHPNVGLAGPQLQHADGTFQNSVASIPSLLSELGQKALLRLLAPQRYYGRHFKPSAPLAVESLVGAALLVRREMVDQIGSYDDNFFFYFEETDWCLRAREAQWQVYFLPDVIIYHGQGKSAKTRPDAARIEYWRSRYYFFKKHYSGWKNLILRVGLLTRLAVVLPINALMGLWQTKAKQKAKNNWAILRWHLQGCPTRIGLPGLRKSGQVIT